MWDLREALPSPVTALTLSIALGLLSVPLKVLIRGRFQREDALFGIELALATVTAVLFYLVDLSNTGLGKAPFGLTGTIVDGGVLAIFADRREAERQLYLKFLVGSMYLAMTIVALFVIALLQQTIVRYRWPPLVALMLVVALNTAGALLVVGFGVYVRGLD